MARIDIGRYEKPKDVGWLGWISWPGWIIFVGLKEIWLYKANEKTGIVVGKPLVVVA